MENEKYNTIVVVDYIWSGHIPTYHKYICKALIELGYLVHSISPAPKEVQQWMSSKTREDILYSEYPHSKPQPLSNTNHDASEVQEDNKVIAASTTSLKSTLIKLLQKNITLKRILIVHEQWKQVAKLIANYYPPRNENNNILVFIPYLDANFLPPYHPTPIFRKAFTFNWSGICFQPYFLQRQIPRRNRITLSTAIFKSKTCNSIAILDENLTRNFSELIDKKVLHFPDITNEDIAIADLSPLAKLILVKARGRKIISLLGVLDNRKNLLLFIEAIKLCNEQNLPFYFVIAGEYNQYYLNSKTDTAIFEDFINQNLENVYTHLQSLTDGDEFNSLIKASDVIAAVYQNFYFSSNILTKAAVFKKPVLVNKGFLMESRVKKYNTGLAINSCNPQEWVDALKKIVINNLFETITPEYDAYLALNSYSRLKEVLAQMVAK